MKSILAQQSPLQEPVGAGALAAGDADRREEEIGAKVERAAESLHRRKEPRPLGKNS